MGLYKELIEEYRELSDGIETINQCITVGDKEGHPTRNAKRSRQIWIAKRRTINQILTAYHYMMLLEGKTIKSPL